ncbi:MAG: cyclic nucleotide-binding domain-containing protein [Acidobacteriota bacterium]
MEGFNKFITEYKKGDLVYKEGEEQNHFYIINKGKVQIKLEEKNLILTTLGKGDFFGEDSLILEQNGAYTVEVIEDSKIIKIPILSLNDMMKKSKDISFKILKKLAEKNIKTVNNLSMLQGKTKIELGDENAPPPISPQQPEENDDLTAEKLKPDIKVFLVIQRSNRVVQLTKNMTSIGRRDYTTGFIPDVDLTKEDEEKYISRKHSTISYSDEKFYISEEAGAVNGTFLNGNKLNTGVKYELSNGDEITLCHLNMVFKF